MNFTCISSKSLLGQVIRLPLKLIPPKTRMPVLRGAIRGHKWIVGSSNHGCWLGIYEYNKQRLFEKVVRKGSTVLDIGAHVGFYTLLSSILVGENGRVFAFEPLPRNLSYLKEHLRLNHITNATVIEAAVSDKSGTAYFSEGISISRGHLSSKGKIQVKTVMMDELIQQGQVNIPDYLKIDVEGAEMLVLTGARSILASAHPTIFLATHGKDVHSQCCDFLKLLGYKLLPIGEGEIHETNEILACYTNMGIGK